MTATPVSNNIDAVLRRDAAISWGWPLFLSGCLGYASVSCLLYWWTANDGTNTINSLAYGFLCAPFCVISCVGVAQIVSGTTCNRLRGIWWQLASWQRVLICSFVLGTVFFLILSTYFLVCVSPIAPLTDMLE